MKYRKWMWLAVSTVAGVLVVTLAVLAGMVASGYFQEDQVQRQPEGRMYETSEPIDVATARNRLGMPFPPSARSIQYGVYSEWQAYTLAIRFEAPVEVLTEYAEEVLIQFNQESRGRSVPVELNEFKPEDVTAVDLSPLSASWFNPENIRNGIKGGGSGSHQPQIWIDLDKGVFYCLYRD